MLFDRRGLLKAAGLSGVISADRFGQSRTARPLFHPRSRRFNPCVPNRSRLPRKSGERALRERIARAQQLMAEHKLDAIVLVGGTSLLSFTGMRWGNSERLFATVIPRVERPFACVCPLKRTGRASS